jgi:neutral ceramidase
VFWNGPEDKDGMLVSGDLPGETSRYIEKRHDDRVVALWCMGVAGDQNPKYTAKRHTFDSQGNIRNINVFEAGYLLMQVQAESLAEEVLLVAANMTKTFSKAVIKGIQKKVMVPGQKKQEKDNYNNLNMIDDFIFEDADPVEMHLSLLLINQIALVGIPGEPVCNLGMLLKNTLPYKNVVVITQCNGSISYISDEAGYEKRTFQATASHLKRGCAEKALVSGTKDMIDELESNL